MIESENATSQGCTHFATFINRVDDKQHKLLKQKLEAHPFKTFILKEVDDLSRLSIADVVESLDALPILLQPEHMTRIIKGIKVAALTLDNFLDHIEEDDIVIVPADRSEIILGLLGALYSSNYPNISGIIFPFGMQAHPNIKKLIDVTLNVNYENIIISPLYQSSLKYYNDIFFRAIDSNKTVLKGGSYNSDDINSLGFGLYVDELIKILENR